MPTQTIRRIALALCATIGVASPVFAQNSLSGSYLAARHAGFYSDFEAASQYFTRALALDPSNVLLLENAMLAYLGLGRVERAVPIARRIVDLGADSQASRMILVAAELERGDFDVVLADQEAGLSVGPLVDGMLGAWALFGNGQVTDALDAFEETGEDTGFMMFADYHRALALALVGDFEGADAIFTGGDQPLYGDRRMVLAHVEILSQLERNNDAVAVINDLFGTTLDPALTSLVERLEAGETLPFETITNPKDGAAEVFYTTASALNGEAAESYTLIYSRLAEFLRPGHVDAMLMTATLLEGLEQLDLASQAYSRVPTESPLFYQAELGRASALEQQDKIDAAIEVLSQLAKTHGMIPIVHVNLGDLLRRQETYDAATKAYDTALGLYDEVDEDHWFIYYARGVTHEREGRWPMAEADFRKALELRPDQPQVLNYLGYSLVEKREKLDEALDMIKRAVASRPNDGYITDSLGWGLYRLGRYDEAVVHMERAVELEPIDPIVNDHLGDVLWAVGRKIEAEFQWKRALSFIDPDDVPVELSPDRIRRKLEIGLDKVLEEEGADPLTVAQD
ncbi:tetratricopeptide repeat protein [Actibacterium pelagium]|uniref:Tetratricopeptide repeat-containing protein n=1 Tax=Actibacterium pelagium TaxID=2029103 RepID=A0A917AIF1_9RHOB|nr:tetratricopeptide repeat protein [Actibacterium pelagium]GGE54095.1 hypothetical protein GCM10011517_22120 [Actibacterium pelagium]